MSQEAMSWVFRKSEAKGHARGVLMWIAYHADENGEGAFPSIRTLSRFTGSTPRQIRYCLRRLEAIWELHTEIAASPTKTNVYSLPGVRKEKAVPPGNWCPPATGAYMYKKRSGKDQSELWSELRVGTGPKASA